VPANKPFNRTFITNVGKEVTRQTIKRLDLTALAIHTGLVQSTPVDIGQARAGWNFGLNHMIQSVPGEVSRPSGSSGALIPPPPTPSLGANTIGDRYHISNFVAHIVFLNEGSSSQKKEPKWVERVIRKAVKAAERVT
jgi:hypothetical protein